MPFQPKKPKELWFDLAQEFCQLFGLFQIELSAVRHSRRQKVTVAIEAIFAKMDNRQACRFFLGAKSPPLISTASRSNDDVGHKSKKGLLSPPLIQQRPQPLGYLPLLVEADSTLPPENIKRKNCEGAAPANA